MAPTHQGYLSLLNEYTTFLPFCFSFDPIQGCGGVEPGPRACWNAAARGGVGVELGGSCMLGKLSLSYISKVTVNQLETVFTNRGKELRSIG